MHVTNPTLRSFLAADRIGALRRAYQGASGTKLAPCLPLISLVVASMIATLPIVASFVPNDLRIDMQTFLIGTAAALALAYRSSRKVPFPNVTSWPRSISLTHTAFALGCIPVILLLLLNPSAVYVISPVSDPGYTSIVDGHGGRLLFIAKVAVWAGLTEEIIYRGLVISVARRVMTNYKYRDIISISLAALLFGAAHLASWGPQMSLALVGLGMGLGLAYVAIGEQLLPIIVYHILFDALSIGFSMLSYRA